MLNLKFAPANTSGNYLGTIVGSGIQVHTPTKLSKLSQEVTNLAYRLNVAMGVFRPMSAFHSFYFTDLDWDWEVNLEKLDTAKDLPRLKLILERVVTNFKLLVEYVGSKGNYPSNWHEYNPRLLEGVLKRANPYDDSWLY